MSLIKVVTMLFDRISVIMEISYMITVNTVTISHVRLLSTQNVSVNKELHFKFYFIVLKSLQLSF